MAREQQPKRVRRLAALAQKAVELLELHNTNSPVYNSEFCQERMHFYQSMRAKELPRVCVTGKLPGINRDEIKSKLLATRFKYKKEVSGDVEFVVLGDRPTRRKVDAAEAMGLTFMSGRQFLRWLEAASRTRPRS